MTLILSGSILLGKRYFNRTKIDKKLGKSNPIHFLVVSANEQKDIVFSLFVALYPTEKKVALFFLNPLISFDEQKVEKLGSEAENILVKELEKITDRKIDYKLSIPEKNFYRIIDVIGGLPVYFDPLLLRKTSDSYERKVGEYNLSGEELSDFLKLKNQDNPTDYLERLWCQETVALILYDHLRVIQKNIRKEWVLLFSTFFDTDLSSEEFISLLTYIQESHLVLYVSEMPAEPITITDGKNKKVQLKVKEEVASIAFSKFVSDLRSEDFADGEFARTEVLNGTEINGLAKSVKSLLNDKRIKVLSTDNAWTLTQENTIIIDRSGNPEYSYKIADVLGVKGIKHIIDKEVGLDTTIILGEDFEIKPGKK
ncbi:MAG TPA: LCP family protein [Leptospiraceae bacterium]|nr:LCP family protein [Leptospiraceae bacterium]HMW08320.1 LCP family protein [Leptospiraceae bacterium]HMX33821.1 LCP family protein [Leptospiraceae bacterium]HMY34427.1 LCP family protein [Leptospiraceae bacterium]HMZ66895.1 LCP family protein [Leptospiraceae bacterium]